MPVDTSITRIAADQTKLLRHLVLWPSIPVDGQLYPYDSEASTVHIGAFFPQDLSPSDAPSPVGCLTLVVEPYLRPQTLPFPPPATQVQLRKFAVLPSMQGQGLGRKLFSAAVDECRALGKGDDVLLHLDSRDHQVGFYERLGLAVLDPEVFMKRGAGGAGPEIPHVRMGKVVHVQ